MKYKKALALPVVIGILIALAVVVIFVAANIGGGVSGDKVNVVCFANIDADVFSKADIESASCERVGACSLFSGFSLGIFTFEEEGNVFMIGSDGKAYDKEPYKIQFIIGGEQDVKLQGCLPSQISDKVTIKAISLDNEIQDTRVVEVK